MASNVLKFALRKVEALTPKPLDFDLVDAVECEAKNGLGRSRKKRRKFRLRLVKPPPEVGSKQWREWHTTDWLD